MTLLLTQQPAVLRLSELSSSYEPAGTVIVTLQDEARTTPHASMDAMEFTSVEELQDIPELTTHDLSTVHYGRLYMPSITLPTIPKQI